MVVSPQRRSRKKKEDEEESGTSTTENTEDEESSSAGQQKARRRRRRGAVKHCADIDESEEEEEDNGSEEDEEEAPLVDPPRKRAKETKEHPLYPAGTKVYKEFPGHGFFHGVIVQAVHDDEGLFYKVEYDDGDEETLTDQPECAPELAALYQAIQAAADMDEKPAAAKKKAAAARKTHKDSSNDKKRDSKKRKQTAKIPKKNSCKGKKKDEDSESEYDNEENDDDDDEDEEDLVCMDDEGESDDEVVVVKKPAAVKRKPQKKNDEEEASGEEEEELNGNKKKASKQTKEEAKREEVAKFDNLVQSFCGEKADDDDEKAAAYKRMLKSTTVKLQKVLDNSKKKEKKKNDHYDVNSILKTPYSDGADLPVLVEPPSMFDDMMQNVLNKQESGVLSFLEALGSQPLRVATMCSGTESPILALDMMQTSLRRLLKDRTDLACGDPQEAFAIEHVFSCEIEPFKQAYIERNFHPPLLFRDIRELQKGKAHTAYGGLVDVPTSGIDLLVAGTSCVDFSTLNNAKKKLEDKGESGQTFFAMLEWVKQALPPIVVIENVCKAPWERMAKAFREIGYAATYTRLDTKKYYIPHTRTRGYLFAVRQTDDGGNMKKAASRDDMSTKRKRADDDDDPRTELWKNLLKALQRPASASLDAFMLHNDDPRVLRGRQRLTAESLQGGGSRAGRTDWTKCETRHQCSRSLELLGDRRPLTDWSDAAPTAMPSFAWNEWVSAQVHRVHDLMDINTLRLATVGIDCTYKTMMWNVSQNVDRDTMGKLGLCPCLTPSGVPYVANRGGPLVGEELLLLQGIPADDLLLTKESEDNLKDLAGNAMSSTVVGACIISALCYGHEAISQRKQDEMDVASASGIKRSLVPRPLLPVSDVQVSSRLGTYTSFGLGLGPNPQAFGNMQELLEAADASARKCVSEGPEDALSVSELLRCDHCGQTSSKASATPARKFAEHSFQPMSASEQRYDPNTFRAQLLQYLPMLVEIQALSANELVKPIGMDDDEQDNEEDDDEHDKQGLWESWQAAVNGATKTSTDGSAATFRLSRVTRSNMWTAHYSCSATGSRLELRVAREGMTWFLFCRAPDKRGTLRDWLESPVAKMAVNDDPLSGSWQICLPHKPQVTLTLTGKGDLVKSWRANLGLKGGLENEQQYETLTVSMEDGDATLAEEINGDYRLQPKCGGACGTLHKKISGGTMFFFLESGRKTLPQEDSMVFATTCHRTEFGEYRPVTLMLCHDKGEEAYRPHFTDQALRTVKACMPGAWTDHPKAKLVAVAPTHPLTATKPNNLTVPLSQDSWKTSCAQLVTCAISAEQCLDLVQQCRDASNNEVVELNVQKSKRVLEQVCFATSRLQIPDLFSDTASDGKWLTFDRSNMQQYNGDDQVCSTCAPQRPSLEWMIVEKTAAKTKKKALVYYPMEDGKQAAQYERALKNRPQPWIVRFRQMPNQLELSIGCNSVSLAQRALGLFPRDSLCRRTMIVSVDGSSSQCQYEWRVVPHRDKVSGDFGKMTFTSNKLNKQADQPPGFDKFSLRREQLRSLAWMLEQEAASTPYQEQEVTEAIMPSLNWRLEARVHRPVLVRGGIIADEVGYGKTAITLGLCDAAKSVNGPPPRPPADYATSHIHTTATLIIVPGHLMGQWPDEIEKFLGKKNVVEIKDMRSFNALTIAKCKQADFVVCNFTVLSNDKYYKRLARLSGICPDSLPSSAGRRFDAVYQESIDKLPARVEQIVANGATAFQSLESEGKQASVNHSNISVVSMDSKKAAYRKSADAAPKKIAAPKALEAAERDPWGLSSNAVQADHTKMTCPPLEMFFWNRVVVDEFTYLSDSKNQQVQGLILNGVKSSFRWCLSGTPCHANFNDISVLANLLGVHLGVEETLPGIKLGSAKKDELKTTLESLSQYMEVRSIQWHERRHALAQSFLDRFVRQNVAEIEEIPYEEHLEWIDLPPAELAIYLELETHLESLEALKKGGSLKQALKSKKKSTGDRECRMQLLLAESDSPEEALLKCCSHFNMMADTGSGKAGNMTALETIDDIITLRKREVEATKRSLIKFMVSGWVQRLAILKLQPDWKIVAGSGKPGEMSDAFARFLEEVQEEGSVPGGADKEVHQIILECAQLAALLAEEHPSCANAFLKAEEDDNKDDGDKKKTADTYEKKMALRNRMTQVRQFGKELCGRIRSLRFMQRIRSFQDEETTFTCPRCSKDNLAVDEVGVLSCCGHFGCSSCLQECASGGDCIAAAADGKVQCTARASTAHIVSSSVLGLHNTATKTKSNANVFGTKITAIAETIAQVTQKNGDRALVFCQFDDLSKKVAAALTNAGVVSRKFVKGVTAQVKLVKEFQQEKPSKDAPSVLILKLDDESSSGLNLTNLNHAFFVHPLLANSQAAYEAYETQAIGRIRRYGQTKTVHVWRFLARGTIDERIYRERIAGNTKATAANNDDEPAASSSD